ALCDCIQPRTNEEDRVGHLLRLFVRGLATHGPALRALHYLEESLKLGTLVSDSTNDRRAIVQLFNEHQPSVIYIPSLAGWCAAIEEGSRSTARTVIANRSHSPTALLAVVASFQHCHGTSRRGWGQKRSTGWRTSVRSFPKQVRRRNAEEKARVEMSVAPNAFGTEMVYAAELALQAENDQRIIALLKIGLVLCQLS
ncbi:hypothetical protein M378DRAFT_173608, partial [Amanita muscaria Koide BX008]